MAVMISVEEAKKIIRETVVDGKVKKLPLQEALGLTLAEDILASTDIPNFAQSSMDGYAIKFADRTRPLTLTGEMAAGTSQHLALAEAQAVRIFTGAPLPEGADTVVMQEKASVQQNTLIVLDNSLSPGMNVRLKGAEVKRGELAIKKHTRLSPAAIGFLAGIGCTHVRAYAPPNVAIIVTGNELQMPGQPLQFGQVYEANSFILTAALSNAGITAVTILHSADNPATLEATLQQALADNDVVLLNGGVSVGDYDYVVGVAHAIGIEQKFHKIKQKPGKPLFFGTLRGKLVFGLPGNPSSGLTCFYEYVLPALEKSLHQAARVIVKNATATHTYSKPSGLTHFLKAHYKDNEVTPLHAQESFRLASFAQANCFIVLPEESTGCNVGDVVEVHVLPL